MSAKYIHSLITKSSKLQRAIDQEQSRPLPDTLRLLRLKKLRLMIKDRITKLVRAVKRPLRKKRERHHGGMQTA